MAIIYKDFENNYSLNKMYKCNITLFLYNKARQRIMSVLIRSTIPDNLNYKKYKNKQKF